MSDFEVNYDGVREIKSGVEANEGFISAIQSFVSTNCNNYGAFTGFMDFFEGDYKSAHRDATTGLSAGAEAAATMAVILGSNIRQYKKRDIRSSRRLGSITVKTRRPLLGSGRASGWRMPGTKPFKTAADMGDSAAEAGSMARDQRRDRHRPDHRSSRTTDSSSRGSGKSHRAPGAPQVPGGTNPLAPVAPIVEGIEVIKTVGDLDDQYEDRITYSRFINGEGRK